MNPAKSVEKRTTDAAIAKALDVSTAFVARMEDLLELDAGPYDPQSPVVCFGELPVHEGFQLDCSGIMVFR
jgi:hypothetical protein